MPIRNLDVLKDILHAHAASIPDRTFAIYPGKGSWSYRETLDIAQRAAAGLKTLGVRKGSRVLTWLPNGPELLQAWFGTNYLGAIHCPCNLAWRGEMLSHAIAVSGARLAIVHADLLPRLDGIALHGIERIIVVGSDAFADTTAVPLVSAAILEAHVPFANDDPVEPYDAMQLMFTSGTTGPSKGVLSSYAQASHFLEPPIPEASDARARFFLVLPLFHSGGAASVYSMLKNGGSIVVPEGFRTQAFWPLIRETGATSTTLVEQMATFLLAQEEAPDDRDNPLGLANIAPLGTTGRRFSERFDVQVWSAYGSTEIGTALTCLDADAPPRAAGRIREGYDLRIVDANDIEVAVGASGELVARHDQPWRMLTEYAGDPEATARLWRNGWLHSGDIFRRDADGWYYFVDRAKDAIRRRGENISSFEVEREMLRQPGIAEAAAIAVPDGNAEDEVMICLVLGEDAPAWEELIERLRAAMPHFMIPRYFRRMSEFPRTANGKIRKDVLRTEGVTACTWDREAAGIIVKAERVGTGDR